MACRDSLLKKSVLALGAAGLACGLIAWPATADPAKPVPQHEPPANAMFTGIKNMGAKIYYLGNKSGLDGWFIIKDKQIQMAYTTKDSDLTLVGALFDKDGENVTAAQINALMATDPAFAAELGTIGPQGAAGAAALPATPSPFQTLPLQSPDAAAPVAAMPDQSSRSEKLFADLTNAYGVTLGNTTAPVIQMVIDPNDGAAKDVWRALRSYVLDGKIQVHLTPMVAQDSAGEHLALALGESADPLTTWDKYVAGDKNQLANPSANPIILPSIRGNTGMMATWNLHLQPPYLVYRDKSGKIKLLQGKPNDAKALIDELQ